MRQQTLEKTLEDLYREHLNKKKGYEKIEFIQAELKKREEDLRSWLESFDHVNLMADDWAGKPDHSVFYTGRDLRQTFIQFFKVELGKAKLTWFKHLRGGAIKCGE